MSLDTNKMKTEHSSPVKKKQRAALYLRVSTEEQNKEGHYGLEVQEERGRSFCESQEYTLAEKHIYKDEKSGGLGIEQRPSLNELFAAAERKEFDVLVVYKTDRLARNLRILVNAIHSLEKISVAFRSVTEPFDTTTSFGRANLNLFGTFAEFEKEVIRERTMSGKLKAAKSGKWVTGIPPYGYYKDENTKKLLKNEKEAKVVRQMFHWLVDEKLSLAEIERRLNQKKVPAPYSTKITIRETHDYWYKRTIGRILINEVYTGTFYYRKYKRPFNNLTSVTEKGGLRPREEWVEMKTDPIISQGMLEAAKKQLLRNREFAKRNRKRDYLYSKLIYCSKCDFKMFGGFQPPRKNLRGVEGIGGRYYHGTYRKDGSVGTSKRCEWCPQYSERRLEPIWETLLEILRNPKNMMAPLERYIYKEDDPRLTKERLEEIDEALETIRKKRARVDDLYINEQLAKEQYDTYHSEFNRDTQKLEDEATRLRQSLLTKKERGDREEAIRKAHTRIETRLDNVSYEDKTKIISFFIERITLHAKEDYAEVVFSFSNQTKTVGIKTVSQEQHGSFPLVLNIRTMSELERRQEIIRANPLMFVPKSLV